MTDILFSLLFLTLGGYCVYLYHWPKDRFSIWNPLIIYLSLVLVRLIFLGIWTVRQTGSLDLGYIQFPDERTYLEFDGEGKTSNLFFFVIFYLQELGAGVPAIKIFNITISSLAIIRVYSLSSYFSDRKKFTILVLVFGNLFIPFVFYSIFILREPILFFILSDLLVRLYRLNVDGDGKISLAINILFASLFRFWYSGLLFLLIIRKGLRISLKGYALLFVVSGTCIFLYGRWAIEKGQEMAIFFHLGGGYGGDFSRSEVTYSMLSYGEIIYLNISSTFMPTDNLFEILSLIQVSIFLIFILRRRFRKYFLALWKLWLPFILLILLNIFTFSNFRYAIPSLSAILVVGLIAFTTRESKRVRKRKVNP